MDAFIGLPLEAVQQYSHTTGGASHTLLQYISDLASPHGDGNSVWQGIKELTEGDSKGLEGE